MHQSVLNNGWDTGSIEKTLVEFSVFITSISRVRLFSSHRTGNRNHRNRGDTGVTTGKGGFELVEEEGLKDENGMQPRGEGIGWGGEKKDGHWV